MGTSSWLLIFRRKNCTSFPTVSLLCRFHLASIQCLFLLFQLKNNLLSFGYRTVENLCSTTYFAFTYPYSYVDLQNSFKCYDAHLLKLNVNPNPQGSLSKFFYYIPSPSFISQVSHLFGLKQLSKFYEFYFCIPLGSWGSEIDFMNLMVNFFAGEGKDDYDSLLDFQFRCII